MKPASPEELKVILQQVGLIHIDVGQTGQGDFSPRLFGSGRVRMPATPKNAAADLRRRLNALGASFRINIRHTQVFVIVWLGNAPKLPVDTVVESLLSEGASKINYKNDPVVQDLLARVRNALSELDHARGSNSGANKNKVEKAIKFLKGENPYQQSHEAEPS